jgi:cytochrome d ubiquinol oxidase subunit II
MLEAWIAALVMAALVAYALLAGADFGGGIWDLFAKGPRRDAQRKAIASAMAPVWEANHVWLIFVIVLLFTAFPRAFAALSVALFGPFHLALVGITLRGAAFVFRAYGPVHTPGTRRWGIVFGGASVVTPLLLGAAMGAVSSGKIRVTPQANGFLLPTEEGVAWLGPMAIVTGLFALALCAYLAAVYLANETEGELREDFRTRGLWAGGAVVVLGTLTLGLVLVAARHLFFGLLSLRALPVVILGMLSGLAAGFTLWKRHWRWARVTAAAEVLFLLVGWGLAQYPFLIYPDVSIHDVAAVPSTLRFVLYSTPVGAVLLVPSLWLLFRVFKRDTREAAG